MKRIAQEKEKASRCQGNNNNQKDAQHEASE